LKDISFVNRLDRDITWCFCPNANLYIENRLPKLDIFVANGLKMSLGTDSLASNDKLCMLSELKTISKHFPSISLDTSIAWATLNGAMHLGIDRKFGSLEVGKRPGLNLITAMDGLNLTEASAVSKLV
jgi:cytosine/adenosine deaminase-related metal-dependent hydrolase